MVNWLIFAEKHDQAKKISDVIFDKGQPRGSFHKGGLGGHNISTILSGEVRIVHFSGHIFEMKMPPYQDETYALKTKERTNRFGMKIGGESKSPTDIFENYPINLDLKNIKWKITDDKFKQMNSNMKKLYFDSENVIVSTDFDNEGEMIFRNWLENNVKRPKWDSFFRVKMNSTTPKDIKKAFQNVIPYKSSNSVLQSMYAQGLARSIADYEYGLSFTFYGWILAKKTGQLRGQYGRLKNSLLGVIYRQESLHDNFEPKINYRIDMVLPNSDELQGANDYVFDSYNEAKAFLERHPLPSTVDINFSEETKEVPPPKLYSRNELLVALMKKHDKKLNKGQSWNAPLQKLYEKHSLLSYPRTDVQYISEEIYKTLQELAQTDSVQSLINEQIQSVIQKHNINNDITFTPMKRPSKKHVNEKALEGESHFALVPTYKEPKQLNKLDEIEKLVYLEDLYRTMSIFCNPCVIVQRHYYTHHKFSSTQKKIRQYGFKTLIDNIPEEKGHFPEASQYPVSYKISEVKAKRPSLFTKMSLISMTKRVNWGTSATRDSTIEQLIEKNAIVLDKNHLRINDQLKPTIDLLLKNDLIDFEMTSKWQTELNELKTKSDAFNFIDATRKDTEQVHQVFKQILN